LSTLKKAKSSARRRKWL